MEKVAFRLVTVDLVDDPPPSIRREKKDYCTVRFVGRMGPAEGNKTVCVWAHDFYPYFYLQLPPDSWQDCQVDDLRNYICENRKTNGFFRGYRYTLLCQAC